MGVSVQETQSSRRPRGGNKRATRGPGSRIVRSGPGALVDAKTWSLYGCTYGDLRPSLLCHNEDTNALWVLQAVAIHSVFVPNVTDAGLLTLSYQRVTVKQTERERESVSRLPADHCTRHPLPQRRNLEPWLVATFATDTKSQCAQHQ